MGILSWFRGESSKDIRLKQDITRYLVFPFPTKKKAIWLNKKAVIPENTVLLFASKGKVLDILPAGEHTLGAVVLPKCSSKFKLYKLDKHGKSRTSFKGYAYFINMLPHKNFNFSTYGRLYFQNELDGRFWANLTLQLDFEVANVTKLMQNLLMEFSYLKINESENILEDWLSDFVSTELAKGGYHRDDFTNKTDEITSRLSLKLEKLLLSVGLTLTALRISEIDLSKKKNRNKNPLKKAQQEVAENSNQKQGEEVKNTEETSQINNNENINKEQQINQETTKETNTDAQKETSTWQGLESLWDDDSDKSS